MNTIYKVIWNDTLRVFQVVNELTRSRGKKTSVSRCSVTDQSYLQGQSEVTGRGEIRKLVLATAVGRLWLRLNLPALPRTSRQVGLR